LRKVSIKENECKGCGLCCWVCPKKILNLDMTRVNSKGYHPVTGEFEQCISCAFCGMVCPDMVITVGGEQKNAS